MKNIKEILKHLPIPCEKLNEQKCLKQIINSLPVVYKNNIKYSYIKGSTIYFVTKHQAINLELYQKLNDIKLILKIFHSKKQCLNIKIDSIKAWSDNRSYQKKELSPCLLSNEYYKYYIKEKKGNFINKAKNPIIKEKFEKIRQIIISQKGK